MCLVLFAHDIHPAYSLVLAANRDEFHDRPTAPAGMWDDAPEVLGGRDLRMGGTWLAVTRSGRWAAVTNYRDPSEFERLARSRGHLVSDFVTGRQSPEGYLAELEAARGDFSGYNLLAADRHRVFWSSNRAPGSTPRRPLGAGIYGLSNHLLDTPWPKVTRGKTALSDLIASPDDLAPERLLDLLLDRTLAAEHELPATGVTLELERALSAAFIRTPGYGTRSSTALLIRRDGGIHFAERRFDEKGETVGEDKFEL
ncbi:MAG: NRDE family protein [Gemmatimonadota bacterium]